MSKRLLVLAVVLLAFAGPGVGHTLAATVIVDDDLMATPPANCDGLMATPPSIQAAVTLAAPGDTVRVCPGVYNETVTVPKTLTITGTLASTARNRCFGSPAPPNPAQDAIVQGPAIYAFALQANGIVLENFVIQGTPNGPGVYQNGVNSGYLVRNNIIQNNVFGLYANAGGMVQSVARANCFRNNTVPGAASGNAIYADQGSRNILIESNRSTLHTSAFNVFAGAPGTQEDITVRANELVQDNTMVFFNSRNVVVAANSIANALTSGTGIFVGGGNDTVLIASNVITGVGLNSSGVSVNPSFGPNANVDVISNSIRNARDGVNVSDPSPGVAEIRGNSIRENRRDGIRMAMLTSLNQITDNFLRLNVEHDCHDDSIGANPGGVANFWIDNDGLTDNRFGALCEIDDDDDDEDDDGDDDGDDDEDDEDDDSPFDD